MRPLPVQHIVKTMGRPVVITDTEATFETRRYEIRVSTFILPGASAFADAPFFLCYTFKISGSYESPEGPPCTFSQAQGTSRCALPPDSPQAAVV